MKAALYARVSREDLSIENQLESLNKWADALGYEVVATYTDTKPGGDPDRPGFKQMLKDARLRKFDVIMIWALDRFSREGPRNTLNYLEQLKHYRVFLKSMNDSWLDTSDIGAGELIIAILAWVAKQESRRISERTKEGIKRAKNQGIVVGRPKGSKDSKKRKKAGYYKRWEK